MIVYFPHGLGAPLRRESSHSDRNNAENIQKGMIDKYGTYSRR